MSKDIILLEKLKTGFNYKNDAELAFFLGITPSAISQIRRGGTSLGVIQRLKIVDRLAAIAVRNAVVSVMPEPLGKKIMSFSLNNAQRYVGKKNIMKDLHDVSTQSDLLKRASWCIDDIVSEINPMNLEKKILELKKTLKMEPESVLFVANGGSDFSDEIVRGHSQGGAADARLIDMFKNHFGFRTDKDLGEFLGLKKAAISNVRKGRSRLGEIARLRMLGEIDTSFDSGFYEASIVSNDIIEGLVEYCIENNLGVG